MTSIVIGQESGKIWSLSDSRITVPEHKDKLLLAHDRAPKIFKLSTSGPDFGIAYAGTSTVGCNVFLALTTCAVGKLATNAKGVASQIARLMGAFKMSSEDGATDGLEATWEKVDYDILIFGECGGAPALYRLCSDISQSNGALVLSALPMVFGDCAEDIEKRIKSEIMGRPHENPRDIARSVLESIQKDTDFQGIGGLILEAEVDGPTFRYCDCTLLANYIEAIS